MLIEGSLKDNLLYGAPAPESEPDHRLSEAIAVAGLDRLTHARGLPAPSIRAEPNLASAMVEARRAVEAALVAEGLDRFVDPFSVTRYNRYATIGENLLFGKAIGDAFEEDRLAGHPFVRAILEANELTKPLARIGAFDRNRHDRDLLRDSGRLARSSSASPSSRRPTAPYFQDLVDRRNEQRRSDRTGGTRSA